MASIPSRPLPVVLSLEPERPASQRDLGRTSNAVITIPITADRSHEQLSWDELLGKR